MRKPQINSQFNPIKKCVNCLNIISPNTLKIKQNIKRNLSGWHRCDECYEKTNKIYYKNYHKKPTCKSCKIELNENNCDRRNKNFSHHCNSCKTKIKLNKLKNKNCHQFKIQIREFCAGCGIRFNKTIYNKENLINKKLYCVNCFKLKKKPKIEKNTQEYKQLLRNKKIQEKKRLMDIYGGKCVCCGETNIEFLCINHINEDGAKHRKELGLSGGTSFYRWLIKNNYPKDNFNILCQNCNFATFFYKICPHQKRTTHEI